jgi:hypothetical protein
MAANFASASSQRLENAVLPLVSTGYPFTIGTWVYPTTTAADRTIWSIADTAVTNHWFELRQGATDVWTLASASGGTTNSINAGTVTANNWFFVLCRCISATSRRITVLDGNGEITLGFNSTSRAPTGLDAITIGCRKTSATSQFMDGMIAEFWLTNTDIQADGASQQPAMMRQLAYGGPFSVPHIAKDIIEYRSLRKYPSSEADGLEEVFHGAPGRLTWTNTNGVTIGPHPPLPYWYEKPGQRRTPLIV